MRHDDDMHDAEDYACGEHDKFNGHTTQYTVSRVDVRFGSKADMCNAKLQIRFTPESGHLQRKRRCPLRPKRRQPAKRPEERWPAFAFRVAARQATSGFSTGFSQTESPAPKHPGRPRREFQISIASYELQK